MRPGSASVPLEIKRWMFKVWALNWYPYRKPSKEIRRTTGWESFVNGRTWSFEGLEMEVGEEKRRKAKAMAAAVEMQVVMRRVEKRKGDERLGRDGDWSEEERRAIDGFEASSVVGGDVCTENEVEAIKDVNFLCFQCF